MRSYLIDTNVLLRMEDKNCVQHAIAKTSVKTIFLNGDNVFVSAQNLIEFWAVATRPREANGFGLDRQSALERLAEIRTIFQFLPDSGSIFTEWCSLIEKFQIQGKRTHDARLVAVFLTSGLDHFVTFDVEDFRNFGISLIHPASVTPTSPSSSAPSEP